MNVSWIVFWCLSAYAVYFMAMMQVIVRRYRLIITAPWYLIALTFLPIGWIFYVVSWRRQRREDAARQTLRRAPAFERNLNGFFDDFDNFDDFDDLDDRNTDEQPVVQFARETELPHDNHPVWNYQPGRKFVPDEAFALTVYTKMRNVDDRRAFHQRQLEFAQERFEDNTDLLRSLSEKLRDAQASRNTIAQEIQQHQAVLADGITIDEFHAHMVESEFQSILGLKGVTGVRVFNGVLSIRVEGRVEYRGHTYDKGEWELRLIPGHTTVWSCETRKGVRKSWRDRYGRGTYPDYILDDDAYCFGKADEAIYQNIQRGQFLQAIELAVLCINSVNDDDRHDIPNAFKRIEE